MLLGDPGIGKSTFLNYVAWLLSRPAENSLIDRMGWRLPLPMVLRELPVRGVTDFDGLLEAFLSREMSAPLREDDGRYLRQALAEGQAFVLLDGIDELGDRDGAREPSERGVRRHGPVPGLPVAPDLPDRRIRRGAVRFGAPSAGRTAVPGWNQTASCATRLRTGGPAGSFPAGSPADSFP